MTTSYELSLRLKELGVEQTGGEYYWGEYPVKSFIGSGYQLKLIHKDSMGLVMPNEIICRALTLGEVVRMLGSYSMNTMETGTFITSNGFIAHNDTPEEAAGELLAETLKQKDG